MLCGVIAVAIAGMIAGTCFPAGVLVVLSASVLILAWVAKLYSGWTLLGALGGAIVLMVVLQFAYLFGAALAHRRKMRANRLRLEQDARITKPTS